MTADRIRVWLGVALLGLVMLGSFWVYEVMRRQSEDALSSTKDRSEPDYYVEHFNFVRLSHSQKTNYRVTGDKLIHFPKEDEFEIIQPRIVGIDQEKMPMTMSAERAIVKQKVQENSQSKPEDQIHLVDKVIFERMGKDGRSNIRLQTSFLVLYPDSEKMRTDKEVKMNTNYSEITATGMRADNAQQKIELLSKVHMVMEKSPLQQEKKPASPTKKKA